jgi:conjugal transfer/entry exclusion protein
MRFKKIVAAILVAGSVPASTAHAGAMAGGASEWTQIMNNIVLMQSLAEQAAMVAQEAMTATNTLNTYKTALQDLTALPGSVMQNMLSPFQNELATYHKVSSAVEGVRSSSMASNKLFETRYADMMTMRDKGYDPKYYLSREAELASRNADAKKRVDDEMAVLQQNEERLRHLQETAKQVPQINSTVGGLQTLAALSAQGAAETAELNKAIRQQMAEKAIDEYSTAQVTDRIEKQRAADLATDMERFKDVSKMPTKTYDYDLKYRTFSK